MAAFVIAGTLLALIGLLLHSIRRGFSARDNPTAIEAWVATIACNMAMPRHPKRLRNRLPDSRENLAAGMSHSADHCAFRHAGNTEIGGNLYPKATDMRLPGTQELSDGENSVRLTGMPAWGSSGDADHNQDTWKLGLFIRHLPKLTADELRQIEKLNLRSSQQLQEETEKENFPRRAPPGDSEDHHD
jgi:hypothetical protein